MIIKVGDRMVGRVEDGEFITARKRKKHFLRNLRGWGISVSVIDKLENIGIKKITLIVDKTDIFKTDIDTVKRAEVVEYPNFEPQYILPEVQWECIAQKEQPKEPIRKLYQQKLF